MADARTLPIAAEHLIDGEGLDLREPLAHMLDRVVATELI